MDMLINGIEDKNELLQPQINGVGYKKWVIHGQLNDLNVLTCMATS